MITANHIPQDDLALFALQLLPEGEMRAASAHLHDCLICREEVAAFQGDLGVFSLGSEMQSPAASARERLLGQVAEETKEEKENRVAFVPVNPTAKAHTNGAPAGFSGTRNDVLAMPSRSTVQPRRAGLFTWTGWALAAGFAGLAALQFHDRQQLADALTSERAQLSGVQDKAAVSQVAVSTLTDPAALNVTLQQTGSHPSEAAHIPQAHAAYLPDRGALVFIASNMEPLKPYKVYELWLLPAASGQAPIPAASFRPDSSGNAKVILPTGPKVLAIKGFGVTMEDDKSAPQKPTLPILMVGTSKA